MTLIELRGQLMKTAGWYDLVNDDLSDNGCNHFINAGIQELELMLGWQTMVSLLQQTVAADQETVQFRNPRYITDVFEFRDGDQVRIWWRPCDGEPTPIPGENPQRQIRIQPVDYERDLIIRAVWHSPTLSEDEHTNFWLLQYPQLAEMAAQLAREKQFRNTQGVNDFTGAIAPLVTRIYHDLIAEEMAGEPNAWIRHG